MSTRQCPEPVDYYFCGNRNLAVVIKLRILRWRKSLYGLPRYPLSVITRVLIREKQKWRRWESRARGGVICFEAGGRTHEPRNLGSL